MKHCKMTKDEIFKLIPIRCREKITNFEIIEHSGEYNPANGRELRKYIVTYDNGDVHEFTNRAWMVNLMREYTTDDGYLIV